MHSAHDISGHDTEPVQPDTALAAETPLERSIRESVQFPAVPVQPDDGDDNDGHALTQEEMRERIRQADDSRAREGWKQWQHRFISVLPMLAGYPGIAAQHVGISPDVVARARAKCPVFDRACQSIKDEAVDRIEAALVVSATVGDRRPIYQGGELVGHERRKSAQAAALLLAAERPAKYRPDGAQTAISITLPPAQLVAEAMARLTGQQLIENAPTVEAQEVTTTDKPEADRPAIETAQRADS